MRNRKLPHLSGSEIVRAGSDGDSFAPAKRECERAVEEPPLWSGQS